MQILCSDVNIYFKLRFECYCRDLCHFFIVFLFPFFAIGSEQDASFTDLQSKSHHCKRRGPRGHHGKGSPKDVMLVSDCSHK